MINVDILSNGQIIAYGTTITDSVRTEKIHFNFPESWNGYVKKAVFKTGETTVNVFLNADETMCTGEDECFIPHEVIKSPQFTVSVFGVSGDSRVTSEQAIIKVTESGYTKGDFPANPTPLEYEQLINLANDTKHLAQSVRNDADNGAFKGEKGDNGINGEDGYTPQKGVDYFTDEDIEGLNIPKVDQTYMPASENASSGKAVSEAISPIRQTITVDTPVWTVQPTIDGVLNEVFETWDIRPYFVTLKNTDGTELESGKFKLCETLDGYASAIDQIFTLNNSSVILSENLPVDFKSISSDRTTFEVRNAGVTSIRISTKNPKSQRYIFSVFQPTVTSSKGSKYIYVTDSFGSSLGKKVTYFSPIGKYSGASGFLMKVTSSTTPPLFKIGYIIEGNRTKSGFVVSFTGLQYLISSDQECMINQYCFSDVSCEVQNFAQEDILWFNLFGGTLFFGNGTVITFEEFA